MYIGLELTSSLCVCSERQRWCAICISTTLPIFLQYSHSFSRKKVHCPLSVTIYESIVMHEAPLTQKSLAWKFALTLEPDVKSVWGIVLPLRENPVHVDSYWRAMVNGNGKCHHTISVLLHKLQFRWEAEKGHYMHFNSSVSVKSNSSSCKCFSLTDTVTTGWFSSWSQTR